MIIKVINKSTNPLPKYGSVGASGADLYANVIDINKKFLYDGAVILTDTQLLLPPGSRALIPSGVHVDIPEGYEIQVRNRSGQALKQGLIVTNGIGTIDEDYKGDIGVILTNTSKSSVIINQGDRIAQLVLMPVTKIEWKEVESLEESERGESGFGSTGTN